MKKEIEKIEQEIVEKFEKEFVNEDGSMDVVNLNKGVIEYPRPEQIKSFLLSSLRLYREAVVEQIEEKIEKITLDALEENFPKQNQEDMNKPSPNNRGQAMVMRSDIVLAFKDILKKLKE